MRFVDVPEGPDFIDVDGNGGLVAALTRGEAAKDNWVIDGEVVTPQALAEAWQISSAALASATERSEVCAVVIRGQAYHPVEFLRLARDDVVAICKQLNVMDASEQLIFWKRKHGALGCKTASEMLSGEPQQKARVAELAHQLVAQALAARYP